MCISLIEIEHDFLAQMNQAELDLLRRITDSVSHLLWLTDKSSRHGSPNTSLVNGLSRALMLEQPSLRFSVLEVSSTDASKSGLTAICRDVLKTLNPHSATDDKEFAELNGLIHVSRFVPETRMNSLFCQRLQESTQNMALAEAQPARLSIGKIGITDTIHFKQLCEPPTSPQSGFIDVHVKAISLNAKDIYVLAGQTDTRKETTALEFSGIVTATGPGVDHLRPGDRVVVLAPNHFTTTERVPAWAAHKLLPSENYTVMATLPVVYSTALYALRDRAHLQAGETVLIHSGSGAFGIAAITIAQRIGAVVYTTAGSYSKRAFISNELGVPETRVFHSRDETFVKELHAATGGKGIDVIVNSLGGDLMHASWSCIASFGRLVEIGKSELATGGKLDMDVFSRNATFTAFDLSDLFYHETRAHRDILSK